MIEERNWSTRIARWNMREARMRSMMPMLAVELFAFRWKPCKDERNVYTHRMGCSGYFRHPIVAHNYAVPSEVIMTSCRNGAYTKFRRSCSMVPAFISEMVANSPHSRHSNVRKLRLAETHAIPNSMQLQIVYCMPIKRLTCVFPTFISCEDRDHGYRQRSPDYSPCRPLSVFDLAYGSCSLRYVYDQNRRVSSGAHGTQLEGGT